MNANNAPNINQIDSNTSVASLRELVQEFVAERDWEVFHTPKNLATSVAIEAAELMEHFQWLTPEESIELRQDRERVNQIGEEMSDVLAYLCSLANALDIDIATAFRAKMAKNRIKHPISKSEIR